MIYIVNRPSKVKLAYSPRVLNLGNNKRLVMVSSEKGTLHWRRSA
jgi:hypothetical protein